MSFHANANENKISDIKFEKLLVITFDNRLCCNEYFSNEFKMASNKLHTLARFSNYVGQDKKRTLVNPYSVQVPQFKYCPLAWVEPQ